MGFRKSATEADLLFQLQERRLNFPPLQIVEVQTRANLGTGTQAIMPDALLTLGWGSRTYRFLVEAKRLWTPSVVSAATEIARRYAQLAGVNPMILVPYLNEER